MASATFLSSKPEPRPLVSTSPHVAVIGGGISGLAAAHHLHEFRPDLRTTLLEASNRLGGVLETIHRDGLLVERSADSFVTSLPWAQDLCERVGLAHCLLPTDESRRRAYVVARGQLHPVPRGFVLMAPRKLGPMLRSPVLSVAGKLRVLWEPLVPRRREVDDESVADFATRRLGMEVFQRLVQPLLAGIYSGDPDRLSMAATMPQFLDDEKQYGSLLRAARRYEDQAASGARYGMFVAPQAGMESMIKAIAARLPAGTIELETPVCELRREDDGWRIRFEAGRAERTFDGVVLATPAHTAAKIVKSTSDALARELAQIEHATTVVVSVAAERRQIAHPLDGFGVVVPRCELRPIIAVSFASQKYPERAPADVALLRVFVGGALQPELAELPDHELTNLVIGQLKDLVGFTGTGSIVDIARWPQSMPQYHLGHLSLVDRIEQLVADLPGFALAGNAYHGVGIPQCIRSGEHAATTIVAHFDSR